MEDNTVNNALEKLGGLSMTVDAEEMQEITRAVLLAPKMNGQEAADFLTAVRSRGIDTIRNEMGEKQFLIKCMRAAAYFGQLQNIMGEGESGQA